MTTNAGKSNQWKFHHHGKPQIDQVSEYAANQFEISGKYLDNRDGQPGQFYVGNQQISHQAQDNGNWRIDLSGHDSGSYQGPVTKVFFFGIFINSHAVRLDS